MERPPAKSLCDTCVHCSSLQEAAVLSCSSAPFSLCLVQRHMMSCQWIGAFLARLGLICGLTWRTLSFMMCCCDPCSVPPKADADSKDASNEASKADDEEKSPATRLQEAVRDSKVT